MVSSRRLRRAQLHHDVAVRSQFGVRPHRTKAAVPPSAVVPRSTPLRAALRRCSPRVGRKLALLLGVGSTLQAGGRRFRAPTTKVARPQPPTGTVSTGTP